MLPERPKAKISGVFALALCVALWAPAQPALANAPTTAPFAGLLGTWTGAGSIARKNGTTERVRCSASETAAQGGDSLDLKLRCSSDTYNFDLAINIVDTDGQVLGTWREATNSVEGGIAGTTSQGMIRVSVRGQAFNAEATIATRKNEQSVSIRSQNGDIGQVAIVLHRAR